MHFSAAVLLSLAATAFALPTTGTGGLVDIRAPKAAKATKASSASAAASTAASAAGVLTSQAYADFQVSNGVAGNALAEVQAKFPIDETNLAGVAASDVAILKAARTTAEDAEVNAGGFNDAIAAASGTAADALQVGKIKNKVLKLKLEVLGLQIDQAQSGTDNSADIAAEQTKLNTNIATDTKSAGAASQSVDFTG